MKLKIFCVQLRTISIRLNSSHHQVPKSSEYPGSKLIKTAFEKYLLITNTVVGGVLMGLGDIVQQEIEFHRKLLNKRYDWTRFIISTGIGLSLGPLNHYFYKYLDFRFPERSIYSTARKILVDQLLMSPFSIAWFFYGIGLLEGRRVSEINVELNRKFLDIYMVDWMLWAPAQILNFMFLPVRYQVLYINIVTMAYNVFLSYMKHKEDPHVRYK